MNQERGDLPDRIGQELQRLCIFPNLHGYYYLSHIFLQVVPDPGWLLLVTKNLYPETGRAFGVPSSCVERGVRTAIANSWECGGRKALDQMTDCHLAERPTNTEFIGIVADYIRRTS